MWTCAVGQPAVWGKQDPHFLAEMVARFFAGSSHILIGLTHLSETHGQKNTGGTSWKIWGTKLPMSYWFPESYEKYVKS